LEVGLIAARTVIGNGIGVPLSMWHHARRLPGGWRGELAGGKRP
jgi:hypothetical protein